MKPFYILIAEDDADDLEMIYTGFKKSGDYYKIETVKNGVELVAYLNEHRQALPDILLTDLNMPKKDGYEALREIFNDADFCQVPVFVYSTTINPLYVERCRSMGVVDFFIKPVKLEEIEALPAHIAAVLEKSVPVAVRQRS